VKARIALERGKPEVSSDFIGRGSRKRRSRDNGLLIKVREEKKGRSLGDDWRNKEGV